MLMLEDSVLLLFGHPILLLSQFLCGNSEQREHFTGKTHCCLRSNTNWVFTETFMQAAAAALSSEASSEFDMIHCQLDSGSDSAPDHAQVV